MNRLALAPLLLLGACDPSLASAPPPPSGQCIAERAHSLVGRPYSAALGQRAMKLSGARTVRTIRPGQLVTMDYRTDRVDVRIDGDNRIIAITCG